MIYYVMREGDADVAIPMYNVDHATCHATAVGCLSRCVTLAGLMLHHDMSPDDTEIMYARLGLGG